MADNSYLKYYWLEKDFFPEIHEFFHKEHYLTPEQFFAIIIWKWNGSKIRIKEGLTANRLSLDVAVKNLTKEIYNAHGKEERLPILLRQRGFKLAMSSAVLTVLYPKDFTVYDVRVRGQLKYPDITYTKDNIERYFIEYLRQVLERGREITHNPTLSLRDCDRVLWAKSWYESLHKFLRA